jgi:hypothetical protein
MDIEWAGSDKAEGARMTDDYEQRSHHAQRLNVPKDFYP